MKRHRCKLCYRNFANGRALGGHMRSHMMNQMTISDEDSQENDEFQSVHSYSSSSEEDQDNRKNLDQEPSVVLDHHRDGDAQSEAESSRNKPLSRIRSKRVRKSRVFYSNRFHMAMNEQSPLSSSVSNTTAEEDVAHCLMMLSRDQKWRREKIKINARVRERKYRCETCSKCFRSYQALGGHRASHKKVEAAAVAAAVVEKVHECPFCDRVFASGQALGGHKRTHFSGSSAISASVGTVEQFSRNGETLDIDLNLPADDDDDDGDDY